MRRRGFVMGASMGALTMAASACVHTGGEHRQPEPAARAPSRRDRGSRSPVVEHAGAMRDTVERGDLTARLDLRTLRGIPGLYGLGPLDRLTGEVTILDSAPAIATVADGTVVVGSGFEHRVPFFVWTRVAAWSDQPLPAAATDMATLQPVVKRAAAEVGIDVARPFPFLLSGTPESVSYHIVNRIDELAHNAERHERIKVHRGVEGQPIEALGFYSEQHRGVFIPAGSFVHLHFVSDDGLASGHIDEARWAAGTTLRLPR